MDKYEVASLITLVLAYKIIIFLIILYEITKCRRSEMEVFHYKRQLYTLAVILLAILFLYFLHIALYHCPTNNVNQEKEEEGNQTGVANPV